MTKQQAFDEYVRRRVADRNAQMKMNRDGWAAIQKQRDRIPRLLRWLDDLVCPVFVHPMLFPPPVPPPLPKDVEVRAIQLGLM